jgi:hypothetical protein
MLQQMLAALADARPEHWLISAGATFWIIVLVAPFFVDIDLSDEPEHLSGDW